MTTEIAEAPEKSAVRIGWGLLALALSTPSLLGAAGFISAYKAGEFTVQVGFAWLVAAVVIDLILKKRDALVKANGRIAAAALALVMALATGLADYRDAQKVNEAKKELIEQFMTSTIEAKNAAAQPTTAPEPRPGALVAVALTSSDATPAAPAVNAVAGGSEADRVVAFLGLMKGRAKKMAEDFAALDRKFTANDLGASLMAENMVKREGIQASRKKIETFKSLINQRNTILTQHFVGTEEIIRNAGLSEREKNDAIAGMNSGKGSTLKNYEELGNAQLGSLKIVDELLNFAERNLGRTSLKDGQMMFQAQPELDEYRGLIQALTESSAKENVVTQKVTAQVQQQKQNLVGEYKK